MTDIRLNKVAIIERCLARIEQEYRGHEEELETNFTRQDSIILNLQRTCEAAIDLAMHMVREGKLGIPQESREAFSILADAGRMPEDLCRQMQAMVGFRNVAVHDYRKLNLEIVRSIIEEHLGDFRAFGRMALSMEPEE